MVDAVKSHSIEKHDLSSTSSAIAARRGALLRIPEQWHKCVVYTPRYGSQSGSQRSPAILLRRLRWHDPISYRHIATGSSLELRSGLGFGLRFPLVEGRTENEGLFSEGCPCGQQRAPAEGKDYLGADNERRVAHVSRPWLNKGGYRYGYTKYFIFPKTDLEQK